MNQQQEQQNRGSGFIKATTPSRPPSAFGAAKPTERTRTMSVSNHRESIAGKQNAPLEPRKSSRSSNNIGFAPSVCGQQGFLSIINNGNAIRRWAVLNGKLLTFYVSQDGEISDKVTLSRGTRLKQNESTKTIDILTPEGVTSIKADTTPEVDLWYNCITNALQ